MRISVAFVVVLLAACSSDDGVDNSKIVLQTQDVKVAPGAESTLCYYLHTNNDEDVVINGWSSDLEVGTHHMILFQNPSGVQPDDHTIDDPCGIVGRTQPLFTYTSVEGHDELPMPKDDGTGKPLGMQLAAHTAMYVNMHVWNKGDVELTTSVRIEATTLPKGTLYTPTSNFLTYNNSIVLPPGVENKLETATCNAPHLEGKKFWSMLLHSHKQTLKSWVHDGDPSAPMIYEALDWEHPPNLLWNADTPFFSLQSTQVSWSCLYSNTGDNKAQTVYAGQSSATDEMCVVSSYYFPAEKPTACIYDTTIPGNCTCFLN